MSDRAPRTIDGFAEIISKVRDVNVPAEEARALIGRAVLEVREKLEGELGLDALLIGQSLDLRDASLHGIDERLDRLRYLASAEIALQQLGLAEEKDPRVNREAMTAAVDEFMHDREARRARITGTLGGVADAVIDLQRELEAAYDKEVEVAVSGAVNDAQVVHNICRLIDHKSGKTDTCDAKKIMRYLLDRNDAVIAELEEDLKDNSFRDEIIALLVSARRMLEQVRVSGTARSLELGKIVMKAATATKIEGLPDDGWYEEILKRAQAAAGGKGGTVDLNTNTGVRFVVAVSETGDRVALLRDVPRQYGDHVPAAEVEKILLGEQAHGNREYPNSAPVYAHVYETGEVLHAFERMRDGDQCSCAALGDKGVVKVKLEKRGEGFVYVGEADGAPDPNQLYRNPAVHMLPWSLRFVIKEEHDGSRAAS